MGDEMPVEKKAEKEWIVMIYLAADNNLAAEGVWALTEIERVWKAYKQAKPAYFDMGVVVLFDTNVPGVETKVYEFVDPKAPEVEQKYGRVTKSGKGLTAWINDPNVKISDNASSPETLKAFVNHVGKLHPAQNYALILSGHGSGAVGDFLKSGKDNLSGIDYKGMSIPSLGDALEAINVGDHPIKIRLLGMDSCVMSMAEVCYELPDNVEWLIGAEGSGPLTGWPYYEILGLLLEKKQQQNPLLTKDIAESTCEAYIQYYSDYYDAGISVDIAYVNLSSDLKSNLKTAVYNLAKYLIWGLNTLAIREAIILAHWRAQSYKFENYTDLWDFCDLLQSALPDDSKVNKYCMGVKDAIQAMAKSRHYGDAFQHSHGLSLFFPWRESWEILEAEKLKFAQDTCWVEFLKKYVDTTRREKRGEDRAYPGQYKEPDLKPVPSSLTGTEEGISAIKLNPPYTKLNPPYTKLNPPYTKLNPPYTKLNPPYTKLNPPYTKGMLGGDNDMKNPPNGFLIHEKDGKDVSDL